MFARVGDEVEWTSQSNGQETHKRGRVERVLMDGERPPPTSKNRNPGMARNHVSFLVRVKGKGLYWPRVSALRLATTTEPIP